MKKYLKGKNVLAAILCATLMLGIVPFTVFAANTDENLLYKKSNINIGSIPKSGTYTGRNYI